MKTYKIPSKKYIKLVDRLDKDGIDHDIWDGFDLLDSSDDTVELKISPDDEERFIYHLKKLKIIKMGW